MVGKPQSAEMHPGPGFRLKNDFERPDPETVAGLASWFLRRPEALTRNLASNLPSSQPPRRESLAVAASR